MSIDVCSKCDAYVDTDFDCDCYVEVGNMRKQTETKCICERCREEIADEEERQADLAGRCEQQAEPS